MSCSRLHLEDEILLLNTKVDELQREREEMTRNHAVEIEKTTEVVRKEMEAEHLIKFSQVSKQIQTLQKTELDTVKAGLQEEHYKVVEQLNKKHSQEMKELHKAMDELRESNKSELKKTEAEPAEEEHFS